MSTARRPWRPNAALAAAESGDVGRNPSNPKWIVS